MSTYPNLLLENQLCFALYSATNAITRRYRAHLRKLGLTYPQYLVLLVMWQHGTLPVSHVARHLGLDSATLTPLLQRLEKAGWLSRIRSNSDQRVVQVSLTDAGQELRHQVAEIQARVACQVGLTEVEFTTLKRSLHELAGTLNADLGEDTDGREQAA